MIIVLKLTNSGEKAINSLKVEAPKSYAVLMGAFENLFVLRQCFYASTNRLAKFSGVAHKTAKNAIDDLISRKIISRVNDKLAGEMYRVNNRLIKIDYEPLEVSDER